MKKQTVPENEVQQVQLLNGVEDLYQGVVVEIKEYIDSSIFIPLLRASLSQWKQQVLLNHINLFVLYPLDCAAI